MSDKRKKKNSTADELRTLERNGQLPNVLRIVDGELICADGRDVREYLREFAKLVKADADTPIIIMTRKGHESDKRDAALFRTLTWAA